MIGIILASVILLVAAYIMYSTLKLRPPTAPSSNESIMDFMKVKEDEHSYSLVGSTVGFPKKDVTIQTDDNYLRIFARVKVTYEDGCEKWESIEKSWRIPDDADRNTISYVINNKEAKITVQKK